MIRVEVPPKVPSIPSSNSSKQTNANIYSTVLDNYKLYYSANVGLKGLTLASKISPNIVLLSAEYHTIIENFSSIKFSNLKQLFKNSH